MAMQKSLKKIYSSQKGLENISSFPAQFETEEYFEPQYFSK